LNEKGIILTPDSAGIKKFGYNSREHILTVQFRDDSIYDYYEVPQLKYEEMRKATDKDLFMLIYIKGHFRYDKRQREIFGDEFQKEKTADQILQREQLKEMDRMLDALDAAEMRKKCNQIYKEIENENDNIITIYGTNEFIPLYITDSTCDEPCQEDAFEYNGQEYFISQFSPIKNKSEWMQEFDGHWRISEFCGILIKICDEDHDHIRAFTYITGV